MKNITTFITESRTGDLFQTVADCISNPKQISDSDIKKIVATVKREFGITLPDIEAKVMADSVITEFPDMINNK